MNVMRNVINGIEYANDKDFNFDFNFVCTLNEVSIVSTLRKILYFRHDEQYLTLSPQLNGKDIFVRFFDNVINEYGFWLISANIQNHLNVRIPDKLVKFELTPYIKRDVFLTKSEILEIFPDVSF